MSALHSHVRLPPPVSPALFISFAIQGGVVPCINVLEGSCRTTFEVHVQPGYSRPQFCGARAPGMLTSCTSRSQASRQCGQRFEVSTFEAPLVPGSLDTADIVDSFIRRIARCCCMRSGGTIPVGAPGFIPMGSVAVRVQDLCSPSMQGRICAHSRVVLTIGRPHQVQVSPSPFPVVELTHLQIFLSLCVLVMFTASFRLRVEPHGLHLR